MKKMVPMIRAFSLGLLAVILIPPMALASVAIADPAPQSYPIEVGLALQAISPVLVELLMGLFALAASFVAAKIYQYTGIKIGQRHFDTLDRITRTAIENSLSRYGKVTVQTESKIMAEVSNYLIKSAPDALKYHGFNKQRLQEFILKRINLEKPV